MVTAAARGAVSEFASLPGGRRSWGTGELLRPAPRRAFLGRQGAAWARADSGLGRAAAGGWD